MPRYIDADRLCKVFCSHCCDDEGRGKEYCEDLKNGGCLDLKLIKNAPTADVVERKRGKWVFIGGYKYQFRCSVCHTYAEYRTRFCPKCGAQMEE